MLSTKLSSDSEELDPSPIAGKPSEWFSHIVIVRTDVRREDFPTEDAYIAEQECIARSEQVASMLRSFKVKVTIVPANEDLAATLQSLDPDLCINFTDTVRGSGALASGIPGIFDLQEIPYVGAGTLALSLNNNKFLTKTLLKNWGIPTPQYQLFHSSKQEIEYDLRYPLIAKLNEEHGSVGIHSQSVATSERDLRRQIQYLLETYKQPVLVEEFIEGGRELTGVVLESTKTKLFLSERKYDKPDDADFKLITFKTKWATDLGMPNQVDYITYDPKDEHILADIKQDLRKAFEILRMDDLGRFDIMLDKYDNYFFIDCNANPSLGPDCSVTRAIQVNNQKFETVLIDILKRNRLDQFTQLEHTF